MARAVVPALALALAVGACAAPASTGAHVDAPLEPPTVATASDPSTTANAAAPPAAALQATAEPSATGQPPGAGSPAAEAALAQLATLAVKGRAPKTGYSRDHFGTAWTDAVSVAGGRNGCDTRNDILRRDLTDLRFKPGSNDCTVLAGLLHDPYTGTAIAFQRGADTSSAVQVDHMVALSDAWQKGAQQLDAATRQDFANDPRNLQATQGRVNQQKGDGDAATWLPPNKAYRCEYVARQIEVKAAYGLWVTAAERDAAERVLRDCSGARHVPPPAEIAAPPPVETAAPTPAPAPDSAAGPDVHYANCAAARAAGVAPILRGEPGYRAKLDGDSDGIACE